MATNEEILGAHSRRDELKNTKRALERTIKNAQKKLEQVQAELNLARAVDDIVDGVALAVISDTPKFFDMTTIAHGPNIMPRNVHGYQIASGKTWAVRVNGGDCVRPLFFGGKVIGLGRGWTRDYALEVAKRWLKGDESALIA